MEGRAGGVFRRVLFGSGFNKSAVTRGRHVEGLLSIRAGWPGGADAAVRTLNKRIKDGIGVDGWWGEVA